MTTTTTASVKGFPIALSNTQRALYPECPRNVPWDKIRAHEEAAHRNHSQTLERLAQRGGLDPIELMAVLSGRKWSEVCNTPFAVAIKFLQDFVAGRSISADASLAIARMNGQLLLIIRRELDNQRANMKYAVASDVLCMVKHAATGPSEIIIAELKQAIALSYEGESAYLDEIARNLTTVVENEMKNWSRPESLGSDRCSNCGAELAQTPNPNAGLPLCANCRGGSHD